MHRRFLVFGLLALLVAVVAGSGLELRAPGVVHAAPGEVFTKVDPPKLYAGDFSHGAAVPAQANPTLGLVGYCVEVDGSGITVTGLVNGFTVTAGSTITGTDYYDGTTPADSTDDVYCATIQAATTGTSLKLSWTYLEGSTAATIELEIAIVTVTLQGWDGVVGGAATVCTVGWDPAFLTGKASNTPLTAPNNLDKVDAGDWTASAGTITGVFKNTATGEWCVGITAGVVTADIDVEFSFYAVYRLSTTSDDQLHTIGSPTNDIVDINDVDFSELRHISLGGQMMPQQDANENVVGARHYACVVPSAVGDVLQPNNVSFSGSGANVSGLEIFHDGAAGSPNFPGVVDGTICLGWTSTQPGEHFLTLSFTKNVGALGLGLRNVSWDTNGDNNDQDGATSGPGNAALLKQWNTISRTEITTGADPRDPDTPAGEIITNGSLTRPIQFNVASGRFLSGRLPLTEWVFGGHTGPTGPLFDLALEGVVLVVRIEGNCGYFLGDGTPPANLGREITGVSYGGRFDRGPSPAEPGEPLGDGPDDISFTIDDDGGCNPSSVVRIAIDAYYPGSPNVFFGTETVEVSFEFTVGTKTPRLAWAGDRVSLRYAFSYSDTCPLAANTVVFTRPSGQPGGFVGSSPDGHTEVLGADCEAEVAYESDMPGEVDIEVFVNGNEYSKVAFPIFYLAFEDVTTTATGQLNVSEIGDLSASVRGWFVGNNPSGRPAEMKPDGRGVPADRWILPTDWETLRGDADSRRNWPSSAPMPVAYVTFAMEREDVVNNWHTGVKNGDAGWLVLDGTESSINVNPVTGIPSVLGTVNRPRILTDATDLDGIGTVDTFGDFNLTYEGCLKNPHTGNPECSVDDMAGHSRYYAIADYPRRRAGTLPPATSNVVQTDWLWAGYKELTIVDTDSPTMKYVVAHLKDRDGYCDAKSFNNLLGIPLQWEIDAGDGFIVGLEGVPSWVSTNKRAATTTTFDTVDDFGRPLNEGIAKPTVDADECQAWIKVSNSMLTSTNVRVSFPPPPSPPPAEVRVTGLVCSGPEEVTIKNMGTNVVSLAGFSLRSRPENYLEPEQYLEIHGFLEPGESRTFSAGPNAPALDWQYTNDEVFVDGDANDWARLSWNGFEMSRMHCDGQVVNPPIPEMLPLDGEGEIVIDITVDFGAQTNKLLEAGWNLVSAGRNGKIKAALAGNDDNVIAIYTWNGIAGRWELYTPSGPSFLNTFDSFRAGGVYWVQVKQPFTIYVPD
ncbi:MAG: hypothetical protein KJ053_07420 [Dehalococcoidia bacterium]|nr:hypothetical protein [Dehalococcoidia bacterium]